jgi:hypothetical protein
MSVDLVSFAVAFVPPAAVAMWATVRWDREWRLRRRADRNALLANEAHERACREWMGAEKLAADRLTKMRAYSARADAKAAHARDLEMDLARLSARFVQEQQDHARTRAMVGATAGRALASMRTGPAPARVSRLATDPLWIAAHPKVVA